MNTVMKSMVDAELVLREYLIKSHKNFYARLKDEKGAVRSAKALVAAKL